METTGSVPRLSIGLPVYNGENYIAGALGSLLDQTFTDFELIICDNASEDRTPEICRVFAASDPRITFLANESNLGAAANYNRTLEHARGEYFKWAAHDDLCEPDFLRRCIEVLDDHPEIVLCHTASYAISDRGKVLGRYYTETAFDHETPATRLWQAISTPHLCINVFGVMRREILLKTIRHGDWVGADRNLLAQLCLFGKIAMLDDLLFRRRDHAEASIRKFEDEGERLAWFNPGLKGKGKRPTWRRFQEYLKAVLTAPLGLVDRLSCLAVVFRWVGANHHTGARNYRLLWQEITRG